MAAAPLLGPDMLPAPSDNTVPFSRFQVGEFFIIIKNILFIMKNLTDFRKTAETGVDPRLYSTIFFQNKKQQQAETLPTRSLCVVLYLISHQYHISIPFTHSSVR